MNYPEVLIPLNTFKEITEDLNGFFLIRQTPIRDFINHDTGFIHDEVLCDNDYRLLDYSTFLYSHFELEHVPIKLIGDNKKYFTTYYNYGTEVNKPIHDQDFDLNEETGYFFLEISLIHNQLEANYEKGDGTKGKARSFVRHLPTNSNFWHFEICWLDSSTGSFMDTKKKPWKNNFLATIKAAVRALVDENIPEKKYLPVETFTMDPS